MHEYRKNFNKFYRIGSCRWNGYLVSKTEIPNRFVFVKNLEEKQKYDLNWKYHETKGDNPSKNN